MIIVEIYRNKMNDIEKFVIRGHSGYARAGSDIVCAAVSSVSQAAVLGLTEVLGLKIGLKIEEDSGFKGSGPYLECILPSDLDSNFREKANILLQTMFLTIKSIEEQYSEYVQILEQEV
ncbi:MAG: ribosomal-processing cysteine protease Prp [Clostridiaceae bacterium]|nr:ribosomal-processing cysteine protease Prp [Clostridiaceae bacterium]